MSNSILVIDDSPNVHKLIKAYLESEPLAVHSAYGGLEGIAAAGKFKPDLVLLDLDMPEVNGFEVCRKLKESQATESLPIIFLTADPSAENRVKGLDLGANDYMSKRFKPEELRARIRSSLRLHPEAADAAMVDGITGLWNRRYLDLHLPAQLSIARRTCRPLSCIVADIDHLSSINRISGDAVGDEMLRGVSHLLLGLVRAEDIACYLGDGKFCILLPGTQQAGAGRLADRVREKIEQQSKIIDGITIDATCSFGVADTCTGADSSVVDRADLMLYCAKHSGRNCVSLSHPATFDSSRAA